MVCYWKCIGHWCLVNLTSSLLTETISFYVTDLVDLWVVDKWVWMCKKSVWRVAASVVYYVAASVADVLQHLLLLVDEASPVSVLLSSVHTLSDLALNLASRINFHHDPCFYTARQGLCHSQHSGKPCLTYQLPPRSLFLHRQTRSLSLSTLW